MAIKGYYSGHQRRSGHFEDQKLAISDNTEAMRDQSLEIRPLDLVPYPRWMWFQPVGFDINLGAGAGTEARAEARAEGKRQVLPSQAKMGIFTQIQLQMC